jgi:hypothetical protein
MEEIVLLVVQIIEHIYFGIESKKIPMEAAASAAARTVLTAYLFTHKYLYVHIYTYL